MGYKAVKSVENQRKFLMNISSGPEITTYSLIGLFLGFVFYPEDGGKIFHRNIG
jgi:hypothetical protein